MRIWFKRVVAVDSEDDGSLYFQITYDKICAMLIEIVQWSGGILLKSTKLGEFISVGVLFLGLVFSDQTLLASPQLPQVVQAANDDSVQVLPGNGGNLPLTNQLLLMTNNHALISLTSNAGARLHLSNNATLQDVIVKNVQSTDTITATYGQVGYYLGKPISAKMVISAIKLHWDAHRFHDDPRDVSFRIWHSMSDGVSLITAEQLTVSYQFFDLKTQQPIDIQDSFLTLSSLDGPVTHSTKGFEYVAYQGSGPIYRVENSIVRQIKNPLDHSQLVMAGQLSQPNGWPYNSSTAATFGVHGQTISFTYGNGRYMVNDYWYTPMFMPSTMTFGSATLHQPTLTVKRHEQDIGG